MRKLVTIGIPVYKRLNYLPQVLNMVRAQDYPNIELLVSDNGMNGQAVRNIVKTCYDRPFKFRQNPHTVSISQHFNQIVYEASGDYFLLLADDDEISLNYVSELVDALEKCPQASVAIAKQEIINEVGVIVRRSKESLPSILSGSDFIEAAWHTYEYKFECFATTLAKTDDIKKCGGYPDFTRGSHNDNALLIKLCLNNYVVLNDRCTFRWRMYESSHGWSIDIHDLADSSKQFLKFLDLDPAIEEFASTHQALWKMLKSHLVKMTWETYLWRWENIYRSRLSSLQWIRAAFAMPLIAAYYRAVASILIEAFKMAVISKIKIFLRGGKFFLGNRP